MENVGGGIGQCPAAEVTYLDQPPVFSSDTHSGSLQLLDWMCGLDWWTGMTHYFYAKNHFCAL